MSRRGCDAALVPHPRIRHKLRHAHRAAGALVAFRRTRQFQCLIFVSELIGDLLENLLTILAHIRLVIGASAGIASEVRLYHEHAENEIFPYAGLLAGKFRRFHDIPRVDGLSQERRDVFADFRELGIELIDRRFFLRDVRLHFPFLG